MVKKAVLRVRDQNHLFLLRAKEERMHLLIRKVELKVDAQNLPNQSKAKEEKLLHKAREARKQRLSKVMTMIEPLAVKVKLRLQLVKIKILIKNPALQNFQQKMIPNLNSKQSILKEILIALNHKERG